MPSPEPVSEASVSHLPAAEQEAVEVQQQIGEEKWRKLLIVTATLLTLFAVCAIAVWLGMAIHHTLVLFAMGALVAYALDPLVELVRRPRFGPEKKQMSRTLAALLVYLGLFAVTVGALWWLGAQAALQVKAVQMDAPDYRDRAIKLAQNFDEQVLKPKGIDFSVAQTIEKPPPEATSYAEGLSKQALPFLAHTASNLAESTVVLLIALYLLIFSANMKEQANSALSPLLLKYAVPWEDDVNRMLGGFVRGQLIIALVMGACAAIGLLAIGVHLWLIIGAFVVVASLIPVFGPYIAAVPAILAALIGPTHLSPVGGAIAVLILFILINEVAGKILYPKLVGEALRLHEVAVLFILFAGLEVGGVIGTLFAAPIASLAIVTLVHLYRLWQQLPEESLSDALQRKEAAHSGLKIFKRARKA